MTSTSRTVEEWRREVAIRRARRDAAPPGWWRDLLAAVALAAEHRLARMERR
jgi:hypothetical protein